MYFQKSKILLNKLSTFHFGYRAGHLTGISESSLSIQFRNFKNKSGGGGGRDDDLKREIDEKKKQNEIADNIFHFIQTAIEVQKIKLEYSDEEKAIIKEYNRQTSIRDAQEKKDLSTKVWLQQQAIKLIPTERLRAAAKVIDETKPPDKRDLPAGHRPPEWSHYAKLIVVDKEQALKEIEDEKAFEKEKQMQ